MACTYWGVDPVIHGDGKNTIFNKFCIFFQLVLILVTSLGGPQQVMKILKTLEENASEVETTIHMQQTYR